MQDDDMPYSGVSFTAADIMLIAECVRFGSHYWNHILNQNPDDQEALRMMPLFEDLLPKIDVLDASREDIDDQDSGDQDPIVEEHNEPEELPNNVLMFPN